jgi:predicted deacylase
MQPRHHPLPGASLGTHRSIVSFHHGPAGRGRKAYIQASLHADELPGMLVAHHLRQRLVALEDAGRLLGEIVVVPVANPIGLGQSVLRRHEGRFELASGENFNRHYPRLFEPVLARIDGRLGPDAAANAALVRAAMREVVADLPAADELSAQRKTLLGLACDAEVVLDLHCDSEALTHLYTGTPLWPQAEPLARLIGSQASLLALASGDDPFDEACSQTWWQLAEHVKSLPGQPPIPLGCFSATLELRGEQDVSHELACADAEALVAFLTHRGLVDGPAPVLPPLHYPATPLAGTDVVATPASGLVVYRRALGDWLRPGDVVADVVDPISGEVIALCTRAEGLLFTREAQRFATAGRPVAKVAGAAIIRSGKLSSQ